LGLRRIMPTAASARSIASMSTVVSASRIKCDRVAFDQPRRFSSSTLASSCSRSLV
jgi:hypothetical protein